MSYKWNDLSNFSHKKKADSVTKKSFGTTAFFCIVCFDKKTHIFYIKFKAKNKGSLGIKLE